jgi:HAMP domain-containing protein
MKGQQAMSDDNVLMPGNFNECFTIYLNADGNPVQRTLREMTAGEVLAAIAWHTAESDRLEHETQRFRDIAKALEAGDADAVPPDTKEAEIKHMAAALREAGEAQLKTARLMQLVHVNMPQWRRRMKIGEALRRYWPGGRAA